MIKSEKLDLFDVAQRFSQNLETAQREREEHGTHFSRALRHDTQRIKDHPLSNLLIGVTIGIAITFVIKGVRHDRTRRKEFGPSAQAA
jgi:hypothetical protein